MPPSSMRSPVNIARASDLVATQFRTTNVGQVETLTRWLDLSRPAAPTPSWPSSELRWPPRPHGRARRWSTGSRSRLRECDLTRSRSESHRSNPASPSFARSTSREVPKSPPRPDSAPSELERPRIGCCGRHSSVRAGAHFLGRIEAARLPLEEARRLPGARQHAAHLERARLSRPV